MKGVQDEKSAAQKNYNLKRVQHGKRCSMKRVQHVKSAKQKITT